MNSASNHSSLACILAIILLAFSSPSHSESPILELVINGKRVDGILDTGATTSILNSELFGCKVDECASVQVTIIDGTVVDGLVTHQVDVEFDGRLITLEKALLVPSDVPVVMGLDFLRNVGMVHIENGVVGREGSIDNPVSVPLEDLGQIARIQIQYEGSHLHACLDTGSSMSLVFAEAMRTIGRMLNHGPRRDHTAIVAGERITITTFLLAPMEVRLGSVIKQIDVQFAPGLDIYGAKCDLLIGHNVLHAIAPFQLDFDLNALRFDESHVLGAD